MGYARVGHTSRVDAIEEMDLTWVSSTQRKYSLDEVRVTRDMMSNGTKM